MTVTLTYDDTNARVSIDADGFSTTADYATVERSVDQSVWTTVRGCTEVDVAAGEFVEAVYDYEFRAGIANYYRVRAIRTDAIAFVSAGVASTGSSGSRTPGLPASMQAGDLVLIHASTRNSGTGTVDDITNWETLAEFGNEAILGRIYDGVWAMPTVTFTGGAANEDTIAQSAAFRNAKLTPRTSAATLLNSSAANIAHPALTVPDDDLLLIAAAWKQDDYTSVAALLAPATWTEIQEASTAAGNDASQVWDYLIQTTAADVAAGSFVVTGGGSAISRAMVLAFEHADYVTEQTNSVTPDLGVIWLKSTMRSFLNRAWSVMWPSGGEIVRPGRGGQSNVLGRTLPIGQTELGGSRRFPLIIRTATAEETQRLDYVAASGDIVFLHTPLGCPLPSMYARMDTAAASRRTVRGTTVHTEIPLIEVAAPGPDVVTALSTWDSLVGDWDDPMLVVTYPAWDDLAELVGDPSEVIVS